LDCAAEPSCIDSMRMDDKTMKKKKKKNATMSSHD
jgi:hypothetical protein